MEILDRSFRIYRRNFFPFFLLALIVQIPLAVIATAITEPQAVAFQASLTRMGVQPNQSTMTPEQAQTIMGPLISGLIGLFVVVILVSLISLLIQLVLVNGTLTYITSENHLGRETTLGGALRAVAARLQAVLSGLASFYAAFAVALIGISLVICPCGVGLIFVFALGGGTQITQVVALCIVGLEFGVIGYGYLAGSSLLVPILTLERGNITTNLGRSWMLGKSRIWAVLAITAAIAIVNGIVVAAISTLATRSFGSAPSTGAQVLASVLATLPAALFAPLLPIAYTEIYFDARVRLEALDVALKSVNAPDAAVKDVPAPAGGRFLAGDDFLNIALFAVGGLILMLLYYFLIMTAFGSQFGRIGP
ncbi:MAG TPA: hypothetical protein VKQ72_14920 [Aggregatilineales bacterium]|nr:hypothetical protein [Aggregatilineales bacterium]